MRLLLPVALAVATGASAQYGTFSSAALKTASANSTLVVLDASNTGYDAAMTTSIKADWKFTTEIDFINAKDLATQPLDPTKNYLMKITRVDKEKHAATFIALVAGWKQKKDEALIVENNAVTNIPANQELASIMVDPKVIGETGTAMIGIYVKHLQDYIKQVQSGKITDKATADRLYAGRTRLIKEMTLWFAQDHLDKSLPALDKIRETYTHGAEVVDRAKYLAIAGSGEGGTALSDVVMTGDNKTKWCFKRIFDANTGELMYLRDDAALYGKKEGFITEDLRMMEQSR